MHYYFTELYAISLFLFILYLLGFNYPMLPSLFMSLIFSLPHPIFLPSLYSSRNHRSITLLFASGQSQMGAQRGTSAATTLTCTHTWWNTIRRGWKRPWIAWKTGKELLTLEAFHIITSGKLFLTPFLCVSFTRRPGNDDYNFSDTAKIWCSLCFTPISELGCCDRCIFRCCHVLCCLIYNNKKKCRQAFHPDKDTNSILSPWRCVLDDRMLILNICICRNMPVWEGWRLTPDDKLTSWCNQTHWQQRHDK